MCCHVVGNCGLVSQGNPLPLDKSSPATKTNHCQKLKAVSDEALIRSDT